MNGDSFVIHFFLYLNNQKSLRKWFNDLTIQLGISESEKVIWRIPRWLQMEYEWRVHSALYILRKKIFYIVWNIPLIENLNKMETWDRNANLRLNHILFRIQVFSSRQHKWTSRFTPTVSLGKPDCNGATLICNPTWNCLCSFLCLLGNIEWLH